MQLHELHPALVHLPITLLPASLAADAAATVRPGLSEAGRLGIFLTAGSAGAAVLSGLIAQEEVDVPEEAHDLLITHRTLNLGLLGTTLTMAAYRARRERAGKGYLAVGLAAMGIMGFSAYLGARMVYDHGVGVRSANGLDEEHAPPLESGAARPILGRAVGDLRRALQHTMAHLREGELVPIMDGEAKAKERHW